MARRISIATGNFGTAGTWGASDATALADTEAASTALDTTERRSAGFTPGAITISGIAVKVAAVASPTGTVTIRLWNNTDTVAVAGTTVTVNASDFPTCDATENQGGWFLVSFAGVLLLAAKSYMVSIQASSASSGVTLYRTSTANDWARQLRTTATGAPGAADVWDVMGEHTGAGTGNNFTVTYNITATTDYGAGTDGVVAATICKRGTLTFGVTASTNYYLKISGDLIVYSGGTLNIGTVGSAMPSTSTAVLEFDPVADGGMRLHVRSGGTWVAQGASKATTRTTLTSDVAAAATVIPLASTSGWAVGDVLAFAVTTRTLTEAETKNILTVDSGVQVTLTAGLANAHAGGTFPTPRGHVVNLTRNIKVRSATSTLMTGVYIKALATVDLDYVEFRYLGENAAGKRGIELETTTGTVNIFGCSIYDCEDQGIFWSASGAVGTNLVVSDIVLYNINSSATASIAGVMWGSTGGGAWTLTNITIIRMQGSGSLGISIRSLSGTCTGLVANAITTTGISYLGSTTTVIEAGTFSDHEAYGGCNTGITIADTSSYIFNFHIENLKAWRNVTFGINIGTSTSRIDRLYIKTVNCFGNGNANFTINGFAHRVFVEDATFNGGGATYNTTRGIQTNANCAGIFYFVNLSSGVTTAHATADITDSGNSVMGATINLINSTLAGSTEVSINALSQTSLNLVVTSHKHDGGSSTFKTWHRTGIIEAETTTIDGGLYSWKCSPTGGNIPLLCPGPGFTGTFKRPVNANLSVTVTVRVRKNGTYAGTAPKLVIVGGIVPGVGSFDVDVEDALSVGADTWETLSAVVTPTEAGVIDFYVACDGSAGAIFVDNVLVTQA